VDNMAINLNRLVSLLISELGLLPDQAKIFIFVLRNGKSTISQICTELKIEETMVVSTLNNLVDNGMLLGLDNRTFMTFHPRFAVVNCHRKRCESGISYGKNAKIDAIGAMLESYYESARPK
jgi:hypothetical protein